MSAHDTERHAEELTRFLTGAADPRQALARSPLAGCPACGELVALAGRLDALGEAERGAMRSALAGPAPAAGEAERILRARMLAATNTQGTKMHGTRAARVPGAIPIWGLAAAVAAVLLAALLWSKRGERGVPDPRLGARLELLHPVGRVDDFADFRWSPAGLDAGWYRIVVRPLDEAGGATGAPTESERILGTTWQPTPEERERWGDRIRWTLEVYRATGASDLVDSKSASAELSSR